MSFNIEITEKDKLEVELFGDLDINTVDSFRNKVLSSYENLDKDIIFCLKNLDYIDSTGLGAIMTVYKEVESKGKELIIHNAKSSIKKLFVITELDKIFKMED